MGGTAGQYLAKLGLRALIVEGVSDTFVYLKLSKGNVEILPADEVAGLGNLGTIETLKGKYGEIVSILSIGQAGEKMLSAAAIAGTTPDFFPRMAGRGGLGASKTPSSKT